MHRIIALLAVALAAVTTAIAVQSAPAKALDDGLALTPPMGWNDWNAFGCNVSAQLVEQTALLAARAKTGHAIVFSICEKTDYGVPNSAWPTVGNLWRTTGDIHDTYASMLSNFTTNVQLASLASPGAWNDPDMLEIGNGGMTVTEEQTELSLWAEMVAPLIAGTDLRNASAQTLATYTNRAVIAVDQDPLGQQGYPVQDASGLWVLTKPLADGDRAVVLFNSTGAPATISTTAAQIGLGAAPDYTLTDLWQGGTTGTTGAISGTVPAHGVLMYDVAPSDVTLAYSHLRVTPDRLENLVSGPEGGQAATLATVRATVTTGSATSS